VTSRSGGRINPPWLTRAGSCHRARRVSWQPTSYVFTTELGGPRDPRNALRAFKAAAKRAGLPSSVGLQTLRHSAASVTLSASVPLKVVSEVFGHASVAITGDIYGHVSPDVSREALTRLSDALS
jgi:integrase